MIRLIYLIACAAAILAGYGYGSGYLTTSRRIEAQEAVVIRKYNAFVLVLVGQNDGPWVERTLRSIFEQDYEKFRLVFVDDDSRDGTYEKVSEFVVANGQQHRVVMVKNEMAVGFEESLRRAVVSDGEIIVSISARDWLTGPSVLSRLNGAFQDEANAARCGALLYPTYEYSKDGLYCFSGALFKQLNGEYPRALLKQARGKVKQVAEPLAFSNETVTRL